MARVLIHAKNMPKYFWVNATQTSCHIINRVHLRKNTKQTPYELWYGRQPNLKYFRVFGSECYVCKDPKQLSKFDTSGEKTIFLGYSQNSRAYRVYNLKTKSIMKSINAVINDCVLPLVEDIPESLPVENTSPNDLSKRSMDSVLDSLPS